MSEQEAKSVSLKNILDGNFGESDEESLSPDEVETSMGNQEPIEEAQEPIEEAQELIEEAQEGESLSADESESSLEGKTKGEIRTITFKRVLQENLTEILGNRLSKRLNDDVAYKIFKECVDSMVEFVRTDEENRLPLAGIGTFMIQMCKPRKAINGTSELSKFEAIPHLKWKPSLRYTNYIFTKILGEPYIDYATRKSYKKK